jgi:hypothetical protein
MRTLYLAARGVNRQVQRNGVDDFRLLVHGSRRPCRTALLSEGDYCNFSIVKRW